MRRANAAADASGTEHTSRTSTSRRSCPRPSKIFCLGLNYASPHPGDRSRPADAPDAVREVPTALIGARDNIWLSDAAEQPDWEVELAFVVGPSRPPRRPRRGS